MTEIPKVDMSKEAKRNEQEILLLNPYEKDLIRRCFEASDYRSKQSMLRGILIEQLEALVADKKFKKQAIQE